MNDDDLDLELDDEPVKREKPPVAKPEPKPAAAKPTPAAAKPAAGGTVSGQRKGLLGGLSNSAAAMKGFSWTGRTFACGLLALLVLLILAENWAPVRFYFLGLALELPKALAFVLDVALGALLMWLVLRRPARSEEAPK